jgi:hypothetical protein
MPFQQAQLPRYTVQILTTQFYLQGKMEPIGPILDYLNDVNRQFFTFLDATASLLTPGPMGQITRSQIVFPKSDIVAIFIDDAKARSSVQLLRRVERAFIYLPSLVCRAELHMGADSRWQDALSLMPGDLFGVTAAMAFPLSPLPGPFPQQADLLILSRLHVKMLHLDQP